MVCVFPGCPEVLAKDFLFTRALMRDDFPTFDLPANATSGNVFLGSLLVITDICIMGWKTGIIVEMVPGIILLLLTKMTEAIGMADGIVLIQLGSICRDGQALLIFCLSLIYIFLYSMILYMLRRDRKRRIPYIPFLFLAYLTTWMI